MPRLMRTSLDEASENVHGDGRRDVAKVCNLTLRVRDGPMWQVAGPRVAEVEAHTASAGWRHGCDVGHVLSLKREQASVRIDGEEPSNQSEESDDE